MRGVTGQNATIYYLGGMWVNASRTLPNGTIEYTYTSNIMNNIIAYDTQVGTWQKHTTKGATLPQSRKEFTVNLSKYLQYIRTDLDEE